MTFNPSLHPRGPGGRFTRSFSRPMDAGDRKRVEQVQSGFRARPPFRTPGDAHGWLSGMSTNKTRSEPGQMDRMLAQLRANNQQLRAGREDQSGFEQLLAPTPEDVTVHRSVPADHFGNAAPDDLHDFVVSDAGYFPTSLAPQHAAPGQVRMEIDVPAGTRAAPSPDTSELVLDRGLHMSVDEVSTGPDGQTTMHLTVLGEGDDNGPDGQDGSDQPEPAEQPVAASPPDGPAFQTRIDSAQTDAGALAAAPSSLVRDDGADLPDEQRAALQEYRGDAAYRSINAALRGASDEELAALPLADPTDRASIDGLVAGMDAAMDASRMTQDVQTFRGIGNASRLFGDRLGGDLTVMEWREDAYVSTSADREIAGDFAGNIPPGAVMMRMLVPAGTGGIELSDAGYEAELLLERGLTMRVVADRGLDEDGVRQIDVEVVPIDG